MMIWGKNDQKKVRLIEYRELMDAMKYPIKKISNQKKLSNRKSQKKKQLEKANDICEYYQNMVKKINIYI